MNRCLVNADKPAHPTTPSIKPSGAVVDVVAEVSLSHESLSCER
jgi:hypothetical protein